MDVGRAITAVGALGTAAYGLVDSTKFGSKGGVSNCGFKFIEKAIQPLFAKFDDHAGGGALGWPSVRKTLHANWINGVAGDEQRAIAKSLIKLHLNTQTAAAFAAFAGVDGVRLNNLAQKMQQPLQSDVAQPGQTPAPQRLNAEDTDTLGRLDLALTSVLEQAYQRADQKYRNSCKVLAVPIAVVLAFLGGMSVYGPADFWKSGKEIWEALTAGLLACPLAPVAKDLSTAVQAAAKIWQFKAK